MPSEPAIDRTLAALADPTRRAILMRLARGEATAGELAEPFALSQPTVSHHLKVLLVAGLIEQRVEGNRRPCRLAPAGLAPVQAWMGGLGAAMEQAYARLDALLADDQTPQE